MTVALHCSAPPIHQVLVKVPLHPLVGVLFAQAKDRVGGQWRPGEDGEIHLGKVCPNVLQNLHVGLLLLVEVVSGEC